MRSIVFGLAIAATLAGAIRPAQAIKPQPPLQIKMRVTNAPGPGDKAKIDILARCNIDLEDVKVTCRLPKGIELPEDVKPEWHISLEKNKTYKISFEAPLPAEKVYKFIGKVTARVDGRRLADIAKLVIDLAGPKEEKTKPNVLELPDGSKLNLHLKKRDAQQ